MGIFRYIVQGVGWELGSQAAREGIDALKQQEKDAPVEKPLTEREQKKLAKAQADEAERLRKEKAAAIARKQAEIEAQLQELKKRK